MTGGSGLHERLEIRLGEPAESLLHMAVGLTARTATAKKKLHLFVENDVPDMDSNHFGFPCSPAERLCQGNDSSNLPLAGERIIWFPFDELRFRYELEFDPAIRWQEITLRNHADMFVLGPNVSIEVDDKERLVLSGSLKRPLTYRITFAVLVLGCCIYAWLVLRSTSYLRVHIWLLSAFWLLCLLLRLGILQGSLTPFNLLDGVLLLAFVGTLGIVATRASLFVQPSHKIFISYRTTDSAQEADMIASRLSETFSKEKVFYASQSITKGENFYTSIEEEIRVAEMVLVVIGPNWLGEERDGMREIEDPDDWPRREVEIALEAKRSLIPLFVRRAAMPEESELPESLWPLRSFNGKNLGVPPEFDAHVAELAADLRAALMQARAYPAEPERRQDRGSNGQLV